MTTPNRPPSCDLPPEHYDEHKGIKPCPICGHDKVGWGAGDIYINEFTNGEVAVQCDHCGVQVNDRTYRESKGAAVRQWNSIPRRSEVAELLRLVEETIIGITTPAEERLQTYANKLREEWKL